jgi:hypothetical protein
MPASGRPPSIESNNDDWYDAQSITGAEEGLITVVQQESDTDHRHDDSSEEEDMEALRAGAVSPLLTMAPQLPKSSKKELYPLNEWHGRVVKRRATLPKQITIAPPSLISFLRKNVFLFASAL